MYSDIAVVQLLAHIANPSIANTQRVGSDVATQIIDLEVQSADGEELDCEHARAGSDGQKAAAVAPWSLVCTATLAEMKPEAS